MPGEIRVLCVHGVGHQEEEAGWQEQWASVIAEGIGAWHDGARVQCHFTKYDRIFDRAKLNAATVAEAIFRLSASGVVHGIGDLFRRPRGIGRLSERVRWTAGMVAQWAADEKLRSDACKAVKSDIDAFRPDVVLAHSLGSLITYDLLARDQKAIDGRILVTFGSQIGNPFVRSVFGGRIVPLRTARAWFHLYNREDDVFTAPLRVTADNFEQVETDFDIEGMADHAAEEYIGHDNTRKRVWRSITVRKEPSRALVRTYEAFSKTRVKPGRRALLVGINDYPNPENRLDGCVNDVFEMSAVLQELGFDPGDIRVVLNERATAEAVRDRLQWLLEGAGAGDTRVFFYSGHGAQIPGYSARDEVDDINECLVTYDFDWSLERAIVDDWFLDFYSQLPYDTDFVAVFDCCHSGGMTRNGLPKARGLNPPDDIRHRTLRWDERTEMWVPRKLRLAERKLLKAERDKQDYLGSSGAVKRMGRAVSLWTEERQFEQTRKRYKHDGPYMPVLLQACKEQELSYEYRHGVTSYGAFTYCLTRLFRQMKRAKKPISLDVLMKNVGIRLRELGYAQTPTLVGPEVKKKRGFPPQDHGQ